LTHYRESLPLARMLDPGERILLAYELDGKPLPLDHGAPLRVISPFDLAYKSAKYVHRIELTAESKPGWWSLANPIYPVQAPVPKDRLRKNR
jgi:DMSO/TMAO reductase YedYZ molybdopterin-dependent catalytic subunit